VSVWTRLRHAIWRQLRPAATSDDARQLAAARAVLALAWEYSRAAAHIARSPVSDGQAREALAARVVSIDGGQRNEQAASHAVASLSLRDDFLEDRAYRLLTAVLEDRPVRPMDPAVAEIFARQERWCRLPLREAFADVANVDQQIEVIVSEAVSAGRRLEIDETRGSAPPHRILC
jgi:hypothetical protein